MVLRSLSLDRAASSLVPRSSRVTTDEAFNAFSIRSLSSTTLIHHRVSKPGGGGGIGIERKEFTIHPKKVSLFFFSPRADSVQSSIVYQLALRPLRYAEETSVSGETENRKEEE